MGIDRNSKTLILNCSGGLGNQMFEYAAGRFFAKQTGRKLEIVKPLAAHQKWGSFERPFQLDQFSIPDKVREENLIDRLIFSSNPRMVRIRGGITRYMGVETIEESKPYHFAPVLTVNDKTKRVYLNGYWQAAAYVQAVEAELREAFQCRSPLRDRNRRYLDTVRGLRCPVSVHCRLGDYELISHATDDGNQRVSNVLSARYYEDAVSAIRDQFDSVTLVVFSDDPAKARRLFASFGDCLFIEGNETQYAHEDLYLMSQCKHHIIANSSSSWWGAWLNPIRDSRVYAPKFWENTRTSYFPDLYLPSWNCLENAGQSI